MNILMVDDDRHQVDSIHRGLLVHGHAGLGLGAAQARAFLAGAEARAVDVLVVDLSVPAPDRLALLVWARQARPSLASLVLAGLATPPELEEALALPVPVLRKPFDAGHLDRAIREAFGAHSKLPGGTP